MSNITNIDWLRLVIPYDYEKIRDDAYKSLTNQPIANGATKEHVVSMLTRLQKALKLYYGVEFAEMVADYEDRFLQWVACDPLWGYDGGMSYGKIKIFYNEVDENGEAPENRLKMGMAIELSGSACEQLREHANRHNLTLPELLVRVRDEFPKVKCTRLDLCYDKYDKNRYLTPAAIWKAYERNQIISKANNFRNYRSGEYTDSGAQATGETTYIGTTPRMLRIYDKAKERYFGHGDKWVNPDDTWIRFEFQFQDVYSVAVFNTIVSGESMENIFFDYLADFMQIVKHKEKNKYGHEILRKDRKSLTAYWKKFVDTPNRKKVNIQRYKEVDVGRRQSWIEKSVSKSFTKQVLAHVLQGGDPVRYINHLIAQGKSRLTTSDYQEIQLLMAQIDQPDELVQELQSREIEYGIYESDDGVEFDFREMMDVIYAEQEQGVNELRMYDIYGNEV